MTLFTNSNACQGGLDSPARYVQQQRAILSHKGLCTWTSSCHCEDCAACYLKSQCAGIEQKPPTSMQDDASTMQTAMSKGITCARRQRQGLIKHLTHPRSVRALPGDCTACWPGSWAAAALPGSACHRCWCQQTQTALRNGPKPWAAKQTHATVSACVTNVKAGPDLGSADSNRKLCKKGHQASGGEKHTCNGFCWCEMSKQLWEVVQSLWLLGRRVQWLLLVLGCMDCLVRTSATTSALMGTAAWRQTASRLKSEDSTSMKDGPKPIHSFVHPSIH